MIRIKEAVVVEGKYDKIKLSSLLEGTIVVTDGFGIFRDRERMAYLRRLAKKQGLLVLTDSDGAGFLIRGKIASGIPPAQLKHAYIPDVPGKERRKTAPSKEGTLGVEGIDLNTLRQVIERAGATILEDAGEESPSETEKEREEKLSKADLFALGLSGGADSAARRKALQKQLGLPEHLSASGLLQAINALYEKQEFLELFEKQKDGGHEA